MPPFYNEEALIIKATTFRALKLYIPIWTL